MKFDIVIRNGVVVDGSGGPSRRADVAISGDRIASIGRVDDSGLTEIDAEGHVVTPGFVDGHTHMDAQVFWDPLGTNLCWHGVTSVVMGNCGFTLAPSRPDGHELVLDNLEVAEDIPAATMQAGIDWTWESFPEYLDAVARVPKAINYAAQIGHSALRTWAMRERAFGGVASSDDLHSMVVALQEALRAGAVGFTTSLSDHHVTADGRPVASRSTSWHELSTLVDTVGRSGAGVFELALDTERVESADVELAKSFYDELADLTIRTGVPTTFGLRRQHLGTQLDVFDSVAERGGSMFGQCQSTRATLLQSFQTAMPFDTVDEWRQIRNLPDADRARALRDPDVRAALFAAIDPVYGPILEHLVVLRGVPPFETVGALARARRVRVTEALFDVALESGPAQLFGRVMTPADEAAVLTAMRHPRTVMTFSDAGAHVSMLSGSDLQTTLLGHWVRDRQEFTLEEAVRMITYIPATAWNFRERGLLREGMIADINVFDPATIGPGLPRLVNDLPAGAHRVTQRATGFLSTIVGGTEVFSRMEHTGAFPGVLVRGS